MTIGPWVNLVDALLPHVTTNPKGGVWARLALVEIFPLAILNALVELWDNICCALPRIAPGLLSACHAVIAADIDGCVDIHASTADCNSACCC